MTIARRHTCGAPSCGLRNSYESVGVNQGPSGETCAAKESLGSARKLTSSIPNWIANQPLTTAPPLHGTTSAWRPGRTRIGVDRKRERNGPAVFLMESRKARRTYETKRAQASPHPAVRAERRRTRLDYAVHQACPGERARSCARRSVGRFDGGIPKGDLCPVSLSSLLCARLSLSFTASSRCDGFCPAPRGTNACKRSPQPCKRVRALI